MNERSKDKVESKYIEKLRNIRTPIIYDVIERFNVRSRDDGWMDSSVKSIIPDLGIMCGIACTSKYLGEVPPDNNETFIEIDEIWEYIYTAPKPSIMVVQDLDYPSCRSCAWGDVSASIFLKLGCEGIITNGAVRDIKEVKDIGFKLFASNVVVGHGYGRFIDRNVPIKVGSLIIYPGDLVHADEHGVIIIPRDIPLKDLTTKIDEFLKSEKNIIDYCKDPNFKINELKNILDRHHNNIA